MEWDYFFLGEGTAPPMTSPSEPIFLLLLSDVPELFSEVAGDSLSSSFFSGTGSKFLPELNADFNSDLT